VSIEVREITIGEHTYYVTQLGTKSGLRKLVQMAKMLGPGMGAFVGGVGRGNQGDLESALAQGFGEAVHEMAVRLDEVQISALVDEFAKNTTVRVSDELQPRLSDIFDDHFAGRYDAMVRWLRFCWEINFSSFLGGSAGRSLSGLWKMFLASQSRPTSTGTSTASQPAGATTTVS